MEQELDKWIEQLADCKQLSEDNVKRLCEKVCLFSRVSLFLFLSCC